MPDRMRQARNPDTLSVLSGMAFAGAVMTAVGFVPETVADVVPRWLGYIWSISLSCASIVSLAGILWRDQLTGWQLELAGRWGVMCTTLGYTLALVSTMTSKWGAMLAVVVFGSLAVASLIRCFHLIFHFQDFQAVVLAQREITRRRK